MKILIDIGHPAHVHFFRFPVEILLDRGHEVHITVRDKDCALDLIRRFQLPFTVLSRAGEGAFGLARELLSRDLALYRHVRRLEPDVLAEVGGIFVAHAGLLARIPSVVFYDTENAKLQNALTYPFASAVIVPRCYSGWLPKARHFRYAGYHELSYLRPPYFHADRSVARRCGLADERDTFLLRVVAWKASHDFAERHWTEYLLREIVGILSERGKVIISSECALPTDLAALRYQGEAEHMHHLMAFCRLYVGESATMASEAAVLGVPAIYAASTGRGYTDEQEARYGLVRNVHAITSKHISAAIEAQLSQPLRYWSMARQRLLDETVDVARLVADRIESHAVVNAADSVSVG